MLAFREGDPVADECQKPKLGIVDGAEQRYAA
jgi:hypothetical protein